MQDVRRELDRLRRGWARARGRDLLARAHLLLLALVAFGALGSRLLGPWPVFGRLEVSGAFAPLEVVTVLLVAGGLALLAPLLRHLAPYVARPPALVLARRLDDARGWQDAADATLSVQGGVALKPVEAFLTAQTVGRLRELDAEQLWPARGDGVWTRRLLLLLFVLALVLPGVDGLLGEGGAGRGDAGGLGAVVEDAPQEPFDADRWLEEHARLYLTVPEREKNPLRLKVRLRTDRPVPVAYRTTLTLRWDDLPVEIGPLDTPAGEEAAENIEVDLRSLDVLRELLTPGRHVARAWLTPREGPWTADLESNDLELILKEEEQDGGGGGGGEEEAPEPTPLPEEEPPPTPLPVPGGDENQPPEPPPDSGRTEVIDPFVREDAEKVTKDDAVVAVRDPDAGLEPPPRIPLSEALTDFERVVERAMGSERIRPADRAFLQRYFEALRREVAPKEDK